MNKLLIGLVVLFGYSTQSCTHIPTVDCKKTSQGTTCSEGVHYGTPLIRARLGGKTTEYAFNVSLPFVNLVFSQPVNTAITFTHVSAELYNGKVLTKKLQQSSQSIGEVSVAHLPPLNLMTDGVAVPTTVDGHKTGYQVYDVRPGDQIKRVTFTAADGHWIVLDFYPTDTFVGTKQYYRMLGRQGGNSPKAASIQSFVRHLGFQKGLWFECGSGAVFTLRTSLYGVNGAAPGQVSLVGMTPRQPQLNVDQGPNTLRLLIAVSKTFKVSCSSIDYGFARLAYT